MDFVCVRYWFRFDDTRFDLFGLKRRNECSKISDQISHVRSTDQKTALKGIHAKSFVLPTHKWSDQHFCLHYKMLITRRMKPAKEKERKKVRRLEWLRSPYKKWQDHSEALNIYLSELFGIFTSIKKPFALSLGCENANGMCVKTSKYEAYYYGCVKVTSELSQSLVFTPVNFSVPPISFT